MVLPIIWGEYKKECLWHIGEMTPDELEQCRGCSKRQNSYGEGTTADQIQRMNNDGLDCPIKQQWFKTKV